MILLGSFALFYANQALLDRTPSDIDYLCTQEQLDQWIAINKVTPELLENGSLVAKIDDIIFEFDVVKSGKSSELLYNFIDSDPNTTICDLGRVPSLNVLFAIKTSHRFRKNSPHFWKTLFDWHKMKKAGATVTSDLEGFVKMRSSEVAQATPKLNVTKKEFFKDDNITYVYDHDSIHVSVANGSAPAYTHYLLPGQDVLCSKKMFDECTHDIKVMGVVEEAAVLAIERSLVPHPDGWPEEKAWLFAFSKVCTSITSGWFREFAYQNAIEIMTKRPKGFWAQFQNDLASGIVKQHIA